MAKDADQVGFCQNGCDWGGESMGVVWCFDHNVVWFG